MVTANINLPNGTKVHVKGTPEEVNKILTACGTTTNETHPKRESEKPKTSTKDTPRARAGVMQHIRESLEDGFFVERRTISDVKSKLEDLGHIYPQTHLSTPLRRMVRNKELRRMKEGKNWVYVQP